MNENSLFYFSFLGHIDTKPWTKWLETYIWYLLLVLLEDLLLRNT